MDAAVDAAAPGFLRGLAKAGEAAGDAGQGEGGGAKRGVVAEDAGEDGGGGGTERRVAGDIFGVRRGDQQRRPTGIHRRGGVVVLISLLDGVDRTP